MGARSTESWRTNNYNELNIIENGFLDEFKPRMPTCRPNNAAGARAPARSPTSGRARRRSAAADHPRLLQRRESQRRRAMRAATPRPTSAVRRTSITLARFNPHPYSFVDAASDGRCDGAQSRALAAGLPSQLHQWRTRTCWAARTSSRTEGRTICNSLALESQAPATAWRSQSSYVLGHAHASRSSCRCASTAR